MRRCQALCAVRSRATRISISSHLDQLRKVPPCADIGASSMVLIPNRRKYITQQNSHLPGQPKQVLHIPCPKSFVFTVDSITSSGIDAEARKLHLAALRQEVLRQHGRPPSMESLDTDPLRPSGLSAEALPFVPRYVLKPVRLPQLVASGWRCRLNARYIPGMNLRYYRA